MECQPRFFISWLTQSGLVNVLEVQFDSHEEVMEELRFGASSGVVIFSYVSSYLLKLF